MWRCVNDVFGYCHKEPDWVKKPDKLFDRSAPPGYRDVYSAGGTCINDPKTCSYYMTLTQALEGKLNIARS